MPRPLSIFHQQHRGEAGADSQGDIPDGIA
jgi:hypothetical protein